METTFSFDAIETVRQSDKAKKKLSHPSAYSSGSRVHCLFVYVICTARSPHRPREPDVRAVPNQETVTARRLVGEMELLG